MPASTQPDVEWDDPNLYLLILDTLLDEWKSAEDAAAYDGMDAFVPPCFGAAD